MWGKPERAPIIEHTIFVRVHWDNQPQKYATVIAGDFDGYQMFGHTIQDSSSSDSSSASHLIYARVLSMSCVI